MRRAMTLALGLALIGPGVCAALAQDEARNQSALKGKQPFEIVRSMQAIQDQIVLGNLDAQGKLPKLMGQIAERLLSVDPASWRDPRNVRAAAVYILSGGQPRVGRKALELGAGPENETRLLEGAVAFVEGREIKARQILLPIDARSLMSALGGYVALTQSTLIAKDDPEKALRLLDQARILEPGTLVEEAALRREIFLADEMGDLDKFAVLSSQYIRRFSGSAYADNFRRRFAEAVTNFGLAGDEARFAKVEMLLSELAAGDQLRLYLKMAQTAIIKGKIGPAQRAAEQAIRLAKDGSVDGARSKLYKAAALILSSSLENGLGELKDVDGSRLPKRDADLKAAMLTIAGQIGEEPGAAAQPLPDSAQVSAPGVRDPAANASTEALIAAAQGALSQTQAILNGSAP